MTIDVRGTSDTPGVIAALPNGQVVVAGSSAETTALTSRTDISAVRLNGDGAVDTTFADAGKLITAFGGPGSQKVGAVGTDGSGRTVMAGLSNADFAVLRVVSSGLDPTFGTGGLATTDFGGTNDSAPAILAQSDGKLIAVGNSGVGSQSDTYGISFARYLPSGALDPTFGTGGTTFTPPPPNTALAANAAVLAQCHVVTVGRDMDLRLEQRRAQHAGRRAIPPLTEDTRCARRGSRRFFPETPLVGTVKG